MTLHDDAHHPRFIASSVNSSVRREATARLDKRVA